MLYRPWYPNIFFSPSPLSSMGRRAEYEEVRTVIFASKKVRDNDPLLSEITGPLPTKLLGEQQEPACDLHHKIDFIL